MISSKPAAGFNHKQYGVTSEGVNVFLRVALEEAGFRPESEPFTVKMTGGTNGDVAGNMIRFLARDYNGNARVVGICDGTATAEDPAGRRVYARQHPGGRRRPRLDAQPGAS